MKQAACLLCVSAILALPLVALGVDGQLGQAARLSASGSSPSTAGGLRGGRQVSAQQHSGVVTQASASALLQIAEAKASRQKQQGTVKRAHSKRQGTRRMHRRMKAKKQKTQQKVGVCRNKLKWWLKVRRKCNKAFGPKSKWDRDKLEGKCADAWADCNTGFYAVCCSQPTGPKDMDAYCAKQNLTFVNASGAKGADKKDKACQVQNKMKDVQDVMQGIKSTIGLMGVKSLPVSYFGPGPGPSPMLYAAPAPAALDPNMPPPGLMPVAAIMPMAPAPAPAPAPVPVLAPVSPLMSKCAMLTELTRQAAEKIHAIKSWAKDDGMQGGIRTEEEASKKHRGYRRSYLSLIGYRRSTVEDSDKDAQSAKVENPEAKDPDLVHTVKGVIHVGEKLDSILKDSNFCNMPADDDDDDEEETGDDKAEDDTEETEDIKINETAILGLLSWEGDMDVAVEKFEKDVHPHGLKWWRYRYEYTIVESIVLAFSVMLLYFVMWLLSAVSFSKIYKFYKTGVVDRMHRYAWTYFVFHAASLMVMVTFAYMLYIPWGEQNIFDIFAEAFHDLVDGRANVPFVGYSWMYMVLDVQFQLFACFALYSVFIVMVVNNFQKALEDWKDLSEGEEDARHSPINVAIYQNLNAVMRRRVENTPAYWLIFEECKLRLDGIAGLDQTVPAWNDFKLHLYLTDGLGKAVEHLVEVSLTTNIFLACSALVVCLLAHYFEVAFMYFLPGFTAIGFLLFIGCYFVAEHYRHLSHKDDHTHPSKYVTVRSFCRAIQVTLYCLFYSFSRLLLSNDIFEFYVTVYIVATCGLLVLLALLAIFAGQLVKQTTCALYLPPHITEDELKKKLEQVAYWHTTEKCHECGAQQFPAIMSLSREWAGKRPLGERQEPPDSARPYSWRG